jgi:putative transposase
MRVLGISSIIRRRRYPKPVVACAQVKGPNLLQRNFLATEPVQKLVTDITYLFVGKQRYYMAAIVDLFNNQVVSYHLSNSPDLQLVLTTLDKWLTKEKDVQGAIVHSDQGGTYTSPIYSNVLKHHGIIQSMSRPGSPLDNAPMESFFGHLKCEAIYPNDIRTFEELQFIIDEYIAFYNNERPQTRLNGCAPVEFLNECA